MGINTATKNFKENLTDLINNSGLPAVNILLVMESIQKEVHNAFLIQMQEETKNEESKEKGEE